MEKTPHYIVLGFAKCGTSSLSDLLLFNGLSHGKSKEPNILLEAENAVNAYNNHYSDIREEGVKRFDASTSYTKWPIKGDAARVARSILGKETKFIVMYRDPLERAVSHVNYDVWRGWPRGSRDLFNPKYIQLSLYYFQITRWLKYYDIKQFLFIDSVSFKNNLEFECKRLSKFLDQKIEPQVFSSNSANNQLDKRIVRIAHVFGLTRLWSGLPLNLKRYIRKTLPKSEKTSYSPSIEEQKYFWGEVSEDYEQFLKMIKSLNSAKTETE
jgi:hypothetical protein